MNTLDAFTASTCPSLSRASGRRCDTRRTASVSHRIAVAFVHQAVSNRSLDIRTTRAGQFVTPRRDTIERDVAEDPRSTVGAWPSSAAVTNIRRLQHARCFPPSNRPIRFHALPPPLAVGSVHHWAEALVTKLQDFNAAATMGFPDSGASPIAWVRNPASVQVEDQPGRGRDTSAWICFVAVVVEAERSQPRQKPDRFRPSAVVPIGECPPPVCPSRATFRDPRPNTRDMQLGTLQSGVPDANLHPGVERPFEQLGIVFQAQRRLEHEVESLGNGFLRAAASLDHCQAVCAGLGHPGPRAFDCCSGPSTPPSSGLKLLRTITPERGASDAVLACAICPPEAWYACGVSHVFWPPPLQPFPCEPRSRRTLPSCPFRASGVSDFARRH